MTNLSLDDIIELKSLSYGRLKKALAEKNIKMNYSKGEISFDVALSENGIECTVYFYGRNPQRDFYMEFPIETSVSATAERAVDAISQKFGIPNRDISSQSDGVFFASWKQAYAHYDEECDSITAIFCLPPEYINKDTIVKSTFLSFSGGLLITFILASLAQLIFTGKVGFPLSFAISGGVAVIASAVVLLTLLVINRMRIPFYERGGSKQNFANTLDIYHLDEKDEQKLNELKEQYCSDAKECFDTVVYANSGTFMNVTVKDYRCYVCFFDDRLVLLRTGSGKDYFTIYYKDLRSYVVSGHFIYLFYNVSVNRNADMFEKRGGIPGAIVQSLTTDEKLVCNLPIVVVDDNDKFRGYLNAAMRADESKVSEILKIAYACMKELDPERAIAGGLSSVTLKDCSYGLAVSLSKENIFSPEDVYRHLYDAFMLCGYSYTDRDRALTKVLYRSLGENGFIFGYQEN